MIIRKSTRNEKQERIVVAISMTKEGTNRIVLWTPIPCVEEASCGTRPPHYGGV